MAGQSDNTYAEPSGAPAPSSGSSRQSTVANQRLVLASASPRRQELLGQIGITPDKIDPADIPELPEKGETSLRFAARIAQEKAVTVATRNLGCFILAADTVVAVGKRILGKADDETQARQYLNLLSGRRHRVHTGMSLILPGGEIRVKTVSSAVVFKALCPHDIEQYIRSGEWRGKAGAYAIQGLGSLLVRQIQGSYTNIVGLPLFELSTMMSGNGFDIWQHSALVPPSKK